MGAPRSALRQRIFSARRFLLFSFLPLMMISTTGSGRLFGQERTEPKTAEQAASPGLVFRGEGDNRELLLRGRFVDAEKQPVENVQLSVRLRKSPGGDELSPTVNGDAFEFWLPVSHSGWSHLAMTATTQDRSLRASHGLGNWQFRKAAVDGIELVMRPPKREVIVNVTHDSKPVVGAHIVVESEGSTQHCATTGAKGTAAFRMFATERMSQLTAWTDDHRIGGYSFDREPVRDALGAHLQVELDDCRNQKIRVVNDDDDSPIPEIEFALTIGTGPPNHNFPGNATTLPQATLITDSKGEVSYPWFPDWQKHGSYLELISKRWSRVGKLKLDQDGVLVQRMRPRSVRRIMYGKVVSPSLDVNGILIEASTFQDEEERRSDTQYAFTDEEGNFSVPCIAGATYCVYVNDENFVSNTIDTIPFDLKTGKSNSPTLQLARGSDVEVHLTTGPKRTPVVNQWINVSTPHSFDWEEDGETKSGQGGRHWGITTDESGIARTKAMAGAKLEATVYMVNWSSGDRVVTVKKDGVTKIEIHREVGKQREITGWLTAPAGVDVNLSNAELTIGAVDGETDSRSESKTDKDGRFAVKSDAREYAIFAYTEDGKAAGSVNRLDAGPVKIVLSPTVDFQGQLLTRGKDAVANHPVWASVYVKGRNRWDFQTMAFGTSFSAREFKTTTDAKGNYTLKNLPANLELRLFTREYGAEEDESKRVRLGRVTLQVDQPQPRKVDKIPGEIADF